MSITLRIDNLDALPDGGPMQFATSQRGFDIGREQHLDWTLPDPNRLISGRHCEVRFENGQYNLYDVSRNGTFLNGSHQRVKSPCRLSDGDRLQIGQYIIAVALRDQPGVEADGAVPAYAPPPSADAIWGESGPIPPPISRRDLMPPAARGSRAADFAEQYIDMPSMRPNQGFAPEQPRPRAPDPFSDAPPPQTPHSGSPFGAQDFGAPQARPIPPASESPFGSAPEAQPFQPTPQIRPLPGGPQPVRAPSPPPSFYAESEPFAPAAAPRPVAPPVPERQAAPPYGQPAPYGQPTPYENGGGDATFGQQPYQAPQNPAPNPTHNPQQSPPLQSPSPQYGAGGGDALMQRMAQGAGVAPDTFLGRDPGDVAEEVGRVLRVVVEELTALLKARSAAKSLAKSGNRTMVSAADNNPLKFIPRPEEVLEIMFARRRPGYMDAKRSVEESFKDLKTHEFATYAAMQRALSRLLEDLSPDAIDKKVASSAFASKKGRAWDTFVATWTAKAEPHENGMLDVFLAYFADAYEKATKR